MVWAMGGLPKCPKFIRIGDTFGGCWVIVDFDDGFNTKVCSVDHITIVAYCPQSFSGGGLYLNGSWLLWSMYDGLLWYMGNTSMSQFHTAW